MKCNRFVPMFLTVIMLTSPFVSLLGGAAPRADAGTVVTVRNEWESQNFTGSPTVMFHDLDHDSVQEILVYGNFDDGSKVLVYDFPGYYVAWSANFTGYIDVSLEDLGDNGSTEIIIRQSDTAVNYTVVSGKTFASLWTSPDLEGSMIQETIVDVDGDGALEFVWMNQSTSGERPNSTTETWLHVYGAVSFQNEWSSKLLNRSDSLTIGNIDADKAQELILLNYLYDEENFTSYNYSLSVIDGATHALQWETQADPNITGLAVAFTGDVDADSAGELLASFDEANDTFGTRSGFRVYGASDGSLEWNVTVGNSTVSSSVTDIDNDTIMELVVTGRVDIDPMNNSYTHYVFDLKTHTELWHLGPFVMEFLNSTGLGALDLNGDGTLEIIVTNSSFDMMTFTSQYSYYIFDGKTFASRWTSPTFHGFGGLLYALPLDSDAQWEALITDSYADSNGTPHCVVHQYRTDTYAEEWTSEDFLAEGYAMGVPTVNDSRFEIVIIVQETDMVNLTSTSQARILDSDTHFVLWTGPKVADMTPSFTDVMGGPRPEIITVINDGMSPDNTHYFTIYNDTTFAKAWESDKLVGTGRLVIEGDVDNDTRKELFTLTEIDDGGHNTVCHLTACEVSETVVLLPDLALFPQDITLSTNSPVIGMQLGITARVHNIGDADVAACCVTLLVDNVAGGTRTAAVAKGNATDIVFLWNTSLGNHTLTIKADPANLIEELEEGNNIASMNFTVTARPKPLAVISSPKEGDMFDEGKPIGFSGVNSTYAPDVTPKFYWESSMMGYLGNTSKFNATLPVGEHLVTLYVDDGSFNSSASVNVTVEPAPPPSGTTWAVITAPRNGASFTAGDTISFDGSKSVAAKTEYFLTYEWSSNLSGVIGTAVKFSRALNAGDQNITLRVDDGHGGKASASVNIKVKATENVVAIISSPFDGQSFEVSQMVTLDGSNSTGPQGAVLTYIWDSNLIGRIASAKTHSLKLPLGNHVITLNVSDGQGHNATTSVTISIKRSMDYPPAVTISAPVNGATVNGTVMINGSAWDDMRVDAVYIRIDASSWVKLTTTPLWFYSWDTTNVTNGVHTVYLKASDGTQSSPEVSINLTVNNVKPPKPPITPVNNNNGQTMLLVGAMVAIFAVAGVVGFMMMRRRPPATAPPSAAPSHPETDAAGPAPPRM
jgi:hypothetical protein